MNAAKRITSMTLAAVLAISLAACGDSTDAADDPDAVVTLILDNVDVTCTLRRH